MADTDTTTPQDAPPADAPEDTTTPPPVDDAPKDGEDGKGGKTAILADLAAERDKRQALEKQVNDLTAAQQSQLDAIAKALGLKQDDTAPDPAKLAEQVTAEQQRARDAQVQLAVYRNSKGVDVDALLDSKSFTDTLTDVDPTNAEAVAAAVKSFVDAHPRFKVDSTPTPGQAGIGVTGGGTGPVDPRTADLLQIQADLAAAKRR